MSTGVIRFSSLGDIVLCGSVTAALAPVTFLTSARFAAVAAVLPGVAAVRTWEAHGRAALRGVDRIVDLHASPRSRLACMGQGIPVQRVRRFDLLRRSRVALKWGNPPPSVVDRYAETAGTQGAAHPWITATGARDTLVLCPGAAKPTKRWSAERFAALGRHWSGPVLVVGSEVEADLVHGIASSIGAEALAEAGFERTLAALGRAAVVVGGDTGLTHLFAAAGAPAITLFGPTTEDDGFAAHPGTPVSVPLSCRPCSRHGSARCPVGDHLCMTRLEPAQVWEAVQRTMAAA